MVNPFVFSELALEDTFCNREKELEELSSHALNKANVVLYSPRRSSSASEMARVSISCCSSLICDAPLNDLK
jgi:hypothetical protein